MIGRNNYNQSQLGKEKSTLLPFISQQNTFLAPFFGLDNFV